MAGKAIASLGLLAGAVVPLAVAMAPDPVGAGRDAPTVEEALAEATVSLLPSGCAGAVVGDGSWVATVAHCIRDDAEAGVVFIDGSRVTGDVAFRDLVTDRVLLHLRMQAPVRPLPLGPEPVQPGDLLLFGSRDGRPMGAQQIEVRHVGPCPSLPGVDALHTTLDARPGDSGSPLVDEAGELVGMVHGGAKCQIATPIYGLELPPISHP